MECPTITGGFYYIRLDDEKEFKQAKKDGLINDELYNMGYETANKLMEELKIFKNDIVNIWVTINPRIYARFQRAFSKAKILFCFIITLFPI